MKYPVHPFLFAISFAIFLFVNNVGEISNLVAYDIVFPPIAVFLLCALIIFWAFKLVVKDTWKVGIASLLTVVFIFYYGVIYDLFKDLHVLGVLVGRHKFLLPMWFLIFSLGIFWTMRTKKDLVTVNKILNIFTIIVILISIINIAIYYVNRPDFTELSSSDKTEASLEDFQGELPDIYYIIPDMYARADVLEEYFGYNNEEFLGFLEDKGFVVAKESRSNYRITYFSLASTMDMEYLDRFKDLKKESRGDYSEVLQIVKDNKVVDFLKNKNYKIIRFRNNLPMIADVDVGRPVLSEYNYLLLDSTILRALGARRSVFHDYFNWRMRENILKSFEMLTKIPDFYPNEPKFVLFHMALPHWPYLFASDGSPASFKFADKEKVDPQEERKYYLEQLKFVNTKIKEAVEEILTKSDKPPVIIIQSDHGYGSPIDSDGVDSLVAIKNISAYYLPDKKNEVVPQSMSPVNTFRIIFDQYFETDLGLLENRSFKHNPDNPYEFKEI